MCCHRLHDTGRINLQTALALFGSAAKWMCNSQLAGLACH